jgi:hypothetical protein
MNTKLIDGNWIDLIALIVMAYMSFNAWGVGFWIILADFLGFLTSLLAALWSYPFIAEILEDNFAVYHSLANSLGFIFAAFVSDLLITHILFRFVKKIPYKFWKSAWGNLAGVIFVLGQSLILLSFIFTSIISFPISPAVKRDIVKSKIGGYLVKNTSWLEAKIKDVFGSLIEDSLTYLMIEQGSDESVPIDYETRHLSVDFSTETEMFSLVNSERRKMGLLELVWSDELAAVARSHAEDMWRRKYFSHYSPEGDDVGDRLNRANIYYTFAGENLALAPTLLTAHSGLMNSDGHRRNILESQFRKIGIGVIDNEIYGKMFVQVFTD